MGRNLSIAVAVLSLVLVVVTQCSSQVTFSRNWEPSGGKRGHTIFPVPEMYFKMSNSICQYLLSEMKQMMPCESRSEEGTPVFSAN